MNTGQMLLAGLAGVLLAILALTVNRSILQGNKTSMESEFGLTATSLAQSLIEEARQKAFDVATVQDTVTVRSSLTDTTNTAEWGPAASEKFTLPDTLDPTSLRFQSLTRYNDFDDYNGYSRTVNTPRAEKYTVSAVVNYVSENSPDSASSQRTFCKRITVTVTSPYLSFPVVLKYVVSY